VSKKQVVNPSLFDVLSNLKNDILKNVNCINIGTIQSFDTENQTATIKLSIKKVKSIDSSGVKTLVGRPLLLECPCFVLSGGGSYIGMPITKGDGCIVLFNDRDIDNWFTSGDGQAPNTIRMHDISDGFALVGIFNSTGFISDFLANVVKIQFNATNKIVLESDKITQTSPENYIEGNQTIDGNSTINGDQELNGDQDIDGDLTQTGDQDITGNVVINGNLTVTGTLAVTGALTCSSLATSGTLSCSSASINGKDFETHTHSAGGYTAGGDNVQGISGGVS
jgi:cytoskeletal protein CcmA (bactofilin family)